MFSKVISSLFRKRLTVSYWLKRILCQQKKWYSNDKSDITRCESIQTGAIGSGGGTSFSGQQIDWPDQGEYQKINRRGEKDNSVSFSTAPSTNSWTTVQDIWKVILGEFRDYFFLPFRFHPLFFINVMASLTVFSVRTNLFWRLAICVPSLSIDLDCFSMLLDILSISFACSLDGWIVMLDRSLVVLCFSFGFDACEGRASFFTPPGISLFDSLLACSVLIVDSLRSWVKLSPDTKYVHSCH